MSVRSEQLIQFVKYCLVGGMNTAITFVVIFVCKSLLGINPYISNCLGYICGLINSFIFNKQWVFHSKGGYSREAIRFVVGFGLCYGLQLLVVWLLTESEFGNINIAIAGFVLSGYGIATVLGNVVYTIANFIYNRLVTFKQK